MSIDKGSYSSYLCFMKSVGIKNLKNNLSRYLEMVRAGELVYVTDRDEVIAEIHRPTTLLLPSLSPWEVWLNEQERMGTLRRAKRRESRIVSDLKRVPPSGGVDWDLILQATREDR